MRSCVTLLLLALLFLNLLAGCAPGPNQFKGTASEQGSIAGFWLGLWQGFIAPFVFVVSLFRTDLSIYETTAPHLDSTITVEVHFGAGNFTDLESYQADS